MAHGPDTEKLLQRIRVCNGETLIVSKLNITSMPSLLPTLEYLYCYRTNITQLPPLPDTLTTLICANTNIIELPPLPDTLISLACDETAIVELPSLPDTLKILYCGHTNITELPSLPQTLEYLDCGNTNITELPSLPDTLEYLDCSRCPLILQRKEDESIQDYNARWEEWRNMKRNQARCRAVRDDLLAAALHPRRMERLIDAYGIEVLDVM
jgi:hypothetical protein